MSYFFGVKHLRLVSNVVTYRVESQYSGMLKLPNRFVLDHQDDVSYRNLPGAPVMIEYGTRYCANTIEVDPIIRTE